MNVKLSVVISSDFIYCLEIKRTEAKLNLTSKQAGLASCGTLWGGNEGREECKTWKRRKAPVLTSLVCLGYTDVFVKLFGGRE